MGKLTFTCISQIYLYDLQFSHRLENLFTFFVGYNSGVSLSHWAEGKFFYNFIMIGFHSSQF